MNLTKAVLRIVVPVALLLASPLFAAEEVKKSDPWERVRFMVGEWEGSSEGKAGTGTVRRTYAFVLEERYLHEKNTSTYPPQEKNKDGEAHDHWSFFSRDGKRGVLVLRQFHEEGFVNQYVLNAEQSSPARIVFDSESFENFDNRWKARETYEIVSPDELVETFELAPPGGALEVYSRNRLRRLRR